VLPRGEVRERVLDESCSPVEHLSARSGHPRTMARWASQRSHETQQFCARKAAEPIRPQRPPLAAAVRERTRPSNAPARDATNEHRSASVAPP
jgi:hypothetical protein